MQEHGHHIAVSNPSSNYESLRIPVSELFITSQIEQVSTITLDDIPDEESFEMIRHHQMQQQQNIPADNIIRPQNLVQKDQDKTLQQKPMKVKDRTSSSQASPSQSTSHHVPYKRNSHKTVMLSVTLDPNAPDEGDFEEGVVYPEPELLDPKTLNITEIELDEMRLGKEKVEEMRKKIDIPDASSPPNKICEFLMAYRVLKESELIQLNSYRTKKNRLSLNLNKQNPDREFDQKACESLVKKLKDKKPDLQNLIDVVISKGERFKGCITIPKTLDGRLQVHGRKGFPHVVYGKLWRFLDMSKNETRHVDHCRHPFETKNDMVQSSSVCVNPYHYEIVYGMIVSGNRESNSEHQMEVQNDQYHNFNRSKEATHRQNIYENSHNQQYPFQMPPHARTAIPSTSAMPPQVPPYLRTSVNQPPGPPLMPLSQNLPRTPGFTSTPTDHFASRNQSTSSIPPIFPVHSISNTSALHAGPSSRASPSSRDSHMTHNSINEGNVHSEQGSPRTTGDCVHPPELPPHDHTGASIDIYQYREICKKVFGTKFFGFEGDYGTVGPINVPPLNNENSVKNLLSPCLGVKMVKRQLREGLELQSPLPHNAPYRDLSYNITKMDLSTLTMDDKEDETRGGSEKKQEDVQSHHSEDAIVEPSTDPITSFWAYVTYYEYSRRIAERKVMINDYVIDGGFVNGANRFALGLEPNPNRTQSGVKVRRSILGGIRLSFTSSGDIWLHNNTLHPLFLSCGYLDEESGSSKEDQVHKVYGQARLKVFGINVSKRAIRDQLYSKYLANMYVRGEETPMNEIYKKRTMEELRAEAMKPTEDLRKYCSILLSFVKGFGDAYLPKEHVHDTPCWLEIKINSAYEFVDEVVEDINKRHRPMSLKDLENLGHNTSEH